MSKFKEVKYKTQDFGCINDGTIINSYLIAEDGDTGKCLLLHPSDYNSHCASFDIAKLNKKGYYEAIGKEYVNADKSISKKILGGNFKFKRKIFKEGKP
jgi:hypothetical protein